MTYEVLVGINVTNDDGYTKYRDAMTPLLESTGGGFRYDFKVSEVLKNEEGNPINRVFAIYFTDKEAMETFFSNKEYTQIRSEFFDSSVDAVTRIAEYTHS